MRWGLRSYARDAGTAGVVAAISLVGSAVAVPDRTGLDLLGYLQVLVGCLTLTARHRAPVVVVAATLACLFAYQGCGGRSRDHRAGGAAYTRRPAPGGWWCGSRSVVGC